jgi:methylated-DNA-protein-cysteine methyltransferase-like protein
MKTMPSPKPKMSERIISSIRSIPRGKVSTYGAVAKAAGFPGAARQVVAALRGAVGLPWQRVLGAGGAIKLLGDHAFEQRFRLEAEGITFRGRKVDMKQHEHRFSKARKKSKSKVAGSKSKTRP